MKKYTLFIFCYLLNTVNLEAQNVNIIFVPSYLNEKLVLNDKQYISGKGDTIIFSTLKCYISNIELLFDGIKVGNANIPARLLDAANPGSLQIRLDKTPQTHFNGISFNIGIDSATNHAGALGGDLDPARGMYWTWQNGYINFKLEGICNICATRHHAFAFHIGGYSAPYNSLQKITLPVSNIAGEIQIQMDIEKFISHPDLSKTNHIMSPGDEAVKLAALFAGIFLIKP